jgi:hypothetical protein
VSHLVSEMLTETNIVWVDTNPNQELVRAAQEVCQCLVVNGALLDSSSSSSPIVGCQVYLCGSRMQRQQEIAKVFNEFSTHNS